MTRATFSVPSISCNHCKASIEQAVAAVAGVAEVVVDVARKQVAVAFDRAAVAPGAIVAAIEDQGYDVARD
jgi:copper chaperone